VVEPAFTRRASYGPSSPTVGSRGAKTRQLIVEAALKCFTERGFHATAIDDIAGLAEISRATLYQYFESKDAIFIELMYESGGSLNRVTRRLGKIGATAEGYDNLHWWLGESTWVFDRYAPMFIEWMNVNSPNAPLRSKLAEFVDVHTERFVAALVAGGFVGPNPAASSILAMALFTRFNYIRHVYRPGLTDAQLLDSLATAVQLFLFPDTPASVLAAGPRSAEQAASASHRPPISDIGPLASLPPRNSIQQRDPFAGLSAQAAQTVRLLLDASGRVFAANGYDVANIDQIVMEAQLARGTFYRYFSDKLELITTLSGEAASVMCPMFEDFANVVDGDPAALREWLAQFLRAQRKYAGVLRAWTEGFPIEPAVLAPAADVVRSMSEAITATFGPPRPYPLDRRAAGMLFSGMLEHFPNEGAGSMYEPDDSEIVEAQALFVERVLVPGGSARSNTAR
jgi:AcrR family transcriptional regulator